jgi:hypothetical protein
LKKEKVMSEVTVETPVKDPQTGAKAQALVGVAPRTFEEGWRFANLIASSELAPKDYIGKPANVLVAIQMGAEIGLAPMAALQNIAVINGRPSVWGDAALAVVQVHPKYESHKEYFEGTGENRKAVFQIKRADHELHTTFFSVADARKAKLWDKAGPWQNYPDRMLQMRARGFGLRDKFADALRGLSIAEEAMDIPPHTIEAEPVAAASLPEAIVRKSDVAPDVLEEARIANDKLQQRRAEEPEPAVKAEEAKEEKRGDLEPIAEKVQGLALEFNK